jgi:hypothetical protein
VPVRTFSNVFKGAPGGAPSAYRRERGAAELRRTARGHHAKREVPPSGDQSHRAPLCRWGPRWGPPALAWGFAGGRARPATAGPSLSPMARQRRPSSCDSGPHAPGVLDHQGDEHRSRVTAGHRRDSPSWHLRGSGRSAFPEPPRARVGIARNPSSSGPKIFSKNENILVPPLDGTRPKRGSGR